MEGAEVSINGGHFEAAVKGKGLNGESHGASKELLITPSPHRMHLYRPSSIMMIRHQEPAEQSADPLQDGKNGPVITYVVIARIDSIRNESHRYWFQLSDSTMQSKGLQVYFSKAANQATLSSFIKNRPEGESVEQLQFEPTRQEGHPYFKVWLKQGREGGEGAEWMVEKVERVRDANEISYHWCAIMYDQLRSCR